MKAISNRYQMALFKVHTPIADLARNSVEGWLRMNLA